MTNLTEYVRSQLLSMADAKESQATFMEEGIERIAKNNAEALSIAQNLRKEAAQLRAAANTTFAEDAEDQAV